MARPKSPARSGMNLDLGTTTFKGLGVHVSLLWVILLFVLVTVIVCVYAGQYENLGKRELPTSQVHGDLTVDGAFAARGSGDKVPSILEKYPAQTALGALTANVTLTAAQVLTGVITADPAAARNFTLPTATLLVDGINGVKVGDTIELAIVNIGTTGADETITLVAGTGVTTVGYMEVATPDGATDAEYSGSGLFRIRFTSVTGTKTYDVIRLA